MINASLAPYACTTATSRGRQVEERAPRFRAEYQRDRDRIIHSAAFRRLEYKTQVFVNHEGDLFRTRLTHSLEVSQVSRAVARALRLNEDLTETIALAHDLGHPPFGHAGQEILNNCMRRHGGFEHNLQSLRVVDELEERYAAFSGLNLTYETREGILKRCSLARAREMGELGVRFLNDLQPSLEAQLVNVADEIAYVCHDIDDGLRAQVLDVEQLCDVDRFRRIYFGVVEDFPHLEPRRAIHETIRHLVDYFVTRLVEYSMRTLQHADVGCPDDVRRFGKPLIEHDAEVKREIKAIKSFLYANMYTHDRVCNMRREAGKILELLFGTFIERPELMPDQEFRRSQTLEYEFGENGRARAVTDYIAGMTDRYAAMEYGRLAEARLHR